MRPLQRPRILVDLARRAPLVPEASLGVDVNGPRSVRFKLPRPTLALCSNAETVVLSLTDKEKWVKALSLDPVTGLDPEGHKVRAAQGK